MSSEDGPGLRTTAFLKGCTLNCAWCHNPESISASGEVLWHKARCIACESCAEVCPQSGINLGAERLTIARDDCLACFSCVRSCPTGAVEAKGEQWEAADLCAELLKDRAYFGSDGGVTLSGGEALMQADSVELLRLLKAAGVNTAVDTCGQVKPERLLAALPYTDVVLYDLKLADSVEHRKWTDVGNELILENLRVVAEWASAQQGTVLCCASRERNRGPSPVARPVAHHGRLWIRTPIIPDATDSERNVQGIADILASLPGAPDCIERWELCAFNNLCTSKYDSIEKTWTLANAPLMTTEQMEHLVTVAKARAGITNTRATGATKSEKE